MNLYYFNPTSDMAIANNHFSYTPPKFFLDFEQNLSLLPILFAGAGDAILTDRKPSIDFLNHSEQWMGNKLPEFLSKEQILKENRCIKEIIPWAWSPATEFQLSALKDQCILAPEWKVIWRELSSRKTALKVLSEYLDRFPSLHLITKNEIPQVCREVYEVDMFQKKYHQIVLKSPWSSSGRGVQVLRKPILNESNLNWIKSTLQSQQYLMAEPLLNKQKDYSFHFRIDKQGQVHKEGITEFQTNSNGQYSLSHLEKIDGIPSCLKDPQLMEIYDQLTSLIQESDYSQYYEGYLGVDAMQIINKQGRVVFQPVVEINMRFSMGLLALKLQKFIGDNSVGHFTIQQFKSREQRELHRKELSQKHPIVRKNNQLLSGMVNLYDWEQDGLYAAYAIVKEK